MTSHPPRTGRSDRGADSLGSAPDLQALRAADELAALTPDLGWGEATGLVDALVDALAHRCVDLAGGREEPTQLPAVLGAIGGVEGPVDHASCRAAAARLRALSPVLSGAGPEQGWADTAGQVMVDLAELLDRIADLARTRTLTGADKGVVLRRLHGLHRQLR